MSIKTKSVTIVGKKNNNFKNENIEKIFLN